MRVDLTSTVFLGARMRAADCAHLGKPVPVHPKNLVFLLDACDELRRARKVVEAVRGLRHLSYVDSHAVKCPARDLVYGVCDCGRDELLIAIHDYDRWEAGT